MSHYLDASFLIPLFRDEAHTSAVVAWLSAEPDDLVVSTYANGEVSSAFSRLGRANALALEQAKVRLELFDEWIASSVRMIDTETHDIADGARIVRNFAFGLRLPDAIHISAAKARGMTLVTLDQAMAEVSRALGVDVLEPG